ncbi:MAG: phasin family protein [Ramlibacter sp.]
MSTRKTQAGTGGMHAASPGPGGWTDLPRQQMAACTHAACALFRGYEAIRRIQQKAAHQALAHHQAIATRLKEPCPPMELLALQAEMLKYDLNGAAAYWQQLAAASLEMQRELLGSVVTGMQAEADEAAANGQATGPDLSPFSFKVSGAQQASAS